MGMTERKKLFVLSDIHGHCSLAVQALEEAGFDPENPGHIMVFCGDLFDRGRENKAVYDFIVRLKHKILIRGNHDRRLLEVLKEGRADMYDLRNGMERTFEEFFGIGSVSEYGELRFQTDGETATALIRLIEGMRDYLETEKYVFVHGWLPTVSGETPPRLMEDWRNADDKAWRSAAFSEWFSMYKTASMPEGKTVVCGHRPTRMAYRVDNARSPADSSIYYGEGLIAIDAGTVRSGRVNVLVLEEDWKT